MNIIEKIASEEGFSGKMYKCPADKLTIGYGFNLEALEMPRKVADLWMSCIVNDIYKNLDSHPWFQLVPVERDVAIIDMVYQMGMSGVLQFKNMISAIEHEDWEAAADAILDSKYARQTPARAKRNADIIRSGEI